MPNLRILLSKRTILFGCTVRQDRDPRNSYEASLRCSKELFRGTGNNQTKYYTYVLLRLRSAWLLVFQKMVEINIMTHGMKLKTISRGSGEHQKKGNGFSISMGK
ncbi:hypothetical protein CEXT_374751 [Caerostris extrusa]|uniref:Uncharacterized protein n=1 Tax=Caerostris extrusa TaxID=172846 RepID=A0AAV4NBD8_CAEEX|nr:hypothetical protein CEXT_374751 [Caerostris extrusa]